MEEIERSFARCFSDFVLESPTEHDVPTDKSASCTVGSAGPTNACFDCNICLDYATDPIVTLCGHLFCWPCIYRWLHLDASENDDLSRNCPVCKSPLSSESSLVPLYGRGLEAKSRPYDRDVPDRPKVPRNPPLSQRQNTRTSQNHLLYSEGHERYMGIPHSTAGALLGEIAFAVLPSAYRPQRGLYTSFYQLPAGSGMRSSWRRQELRAEEWLHQLWVFLFCCAILCYLLL